MSPQLDYTIAPANARVGALATSESGIHAEAKVASVNIGFGLAVVRATDDLLARLPASMADVLSLVGAGGVAVATNAIVTNDDNGDSPFPYFPAGKEFACLRRGPVFVLVEEDVVQGEQAFVRFANAVAAQDADYLAVGPANQKGSFRASADGVAQVVTLSPVAANNADYSVEVFDDSGKLLASAQVVSSGAATPTNIVAQLKAALGVIPGIVMSGVATLIFTASVPGVAFSVESSDSIGNVLTTPNSQSAAKAPGMYYGASGVAGSLVRLNVTLGGK